MTTQSTGNQPSQNPAELGTFQGVFKAVLRKFLQGVDDMLPARETLSPPVVSNATNGCTCAMFVSLL